VILIPSEYLLETFQVPGNRCIKAFFAVGSEPECAVALATDTPIDTGVPDAHTIIGEASPHKVFEGEAQGLFSVEISLLILGR
jgi:hypothetical protein